jgi:hypothetical protein
MATASPSPRSLEKRLAQLERLLAGQQQEIAQQRERIARQDARLTEQDAEIERLRATPAAPRVALMPVLSARAVSAELLATEDVSAPGTDQPTKRNSRRTLLKLGGAAAAAGVAAMAVGASELAYPGTAHAHVDAVTFGPITATGTTMGI